MSQKKVKARSVNTVEEEKDKKRPQKYSGPHLRFGIFLSFFFFLKGSKANRGGAVLNNIIPASINRTLIHLCLYQSTVICRTYRSKQSLSTLWD